MAEGEAQEGSKAVRVTVRGRVQGVFFRQTTQQRARKLGVMGWVRNQDDGTVLVHAEGTTAALDELLAYLNHGPQGARVDELDVRPVKVEGHEQFAIRGISAGSFLVLERGSEENASSRREGGEAGYELRLEVGDAWRVWRLAKAPSMVPADKRLAIQQEELPLDDDATDATGTSVWDSGPYEQGGRVPWPEAIERGHAVFVLHGERLRGGFALQRTGKGSDPRWLLIKRRDEFAEPG